MPVADTLKSVKDTASTNFDNWKGIMKGSAKSAGLGNGSGPLGFGVLGSGGGSIRQRVGDAISGRNMGRLSARKVWVEGRQVSLGSGTRSNDPIIP